MCIFHADAPSLHRREAIKNALIGSLVGCLYNFNISEVYEQQNRKVAGIVRRPYISFPDACRAHNMVHEDGKHEGQDESYLVDHWL
jgi:hypothetical protein